MATGAAVVDTVRTDGDFRATYVDPTVEAMMGCGSDESRFRRLVENSPDVLYVFSSTRGGVYYSPQVETLVGYSLDYLYAHPFTWNESIHPDDLPRIAKSIAETSQGRRFTVDYRIRTAGGDWHWVHDRAIELRNEGGETLIEGLATDITERKQAEQAIREAEARWKAMLNALPDLMFRMDREGRYLEFHSSDEGDLYAPPVEFLGKKAADVLPPDANRVLMAALNEAAINGTSFGKTIALPIADVPKWFELSVAVLREGPDAAEHFIILSRDVTERRAREEELGRAKREAEAASVAKNAFLANMSHEIRTPLNAILGLAQVLEQNPAGSAESQEIGRRIRDAGDLLLRSLNDVLDLAKIEAGQADIVPTPFRVGQLLADAENLVASLVRSKGLVLRVGVAGLDDVFLVGDCGRIQQVLLNLLANAVKFTASGEILLQISVVAMDGELMRLRFEVRDSGIGIAADALARLFTPFTQADAKIGRRYGGTGLGLAISRGLVELMGGSIGAESTEGIGSRFWFELPLPRAMDSELLRGVRVPQEAARAAPASKPLRTLRVLAVDDSRMNLDVLERFLVRDGATVTLAGDGAEALKVLQAQPRAFDVVLMDIRMPVMDGLEATRTIRADPELRDLPVVALTAGVMPEERAAAEAAGVTEFLPKPIDLGPMRKLLLRLVPPA